MPSKNFPIIISPNVCNGLTPPKRKIPNAHRTPYGFTTPRGYIHPINPRLTRDFHFLLGATRAHPLSGLTALHEVHVLYGDHYRRTWEVKPRQQQRRK
jgi:hypothetical protein